MTSLLDRTASEPLHIQLKRAVLGEIREGRMHPGDRLPSEQELEDRYGVSRTTIRQAVASLATDGIVARIQGKGTFLQDPEVSHVPRLTSFTQNMLAQGHVPSKELLESARVAAPLTPAIASADDAYGGQCRYLRRLLLADGRPIGVADTWLPLVALKGHDEPLEGDRLREQSLYHVLEAPPILLQMRRGVELVYASPAEPALAHLLRAPVDSPLLVAERSTYTGEGAPAEFTRMSFAANRYVYRVELGV